MTLAWVGAVLVGAAGVVLGQLLGQGARRRPAELAGWQTALHVLAGEIDYRAAPLAQALDVAGRAARGTAGRALRTVAGRLTEGTGLEASAAWTEAVAPALKAAALAGPEQEALLDLGAVLGRTGRTDQVRQLALAQQRLAAAARAAADRAERDARLWTYLCTCGGLALAIVLL